MRKIPMEATQPRARRAPQPGPRLPAAAAAAPEARPPAAAALLPLALLVFTTTGQLLVVAPLLPRISAELGTGPAALGSLYAAEAAAAAVFALLAGPVSDRIGRRRVLLLGSGLLAASLAAHLAAGTLGALIALRALTGAAEGMLTGATAAYVADAFAYARRGWANGRVSAGTALAQLVGIPASALLGTAFGFRTGFLGFAATAALSFLLVWRYVPQPEVARLAGGLGPGVVLRRYRELLGRPDVLRAGAALALLYAGTGLFVGYLPMWLEAERGALPSETALLFVAGGVGSALGGPLAGRLSDRHGRRRVIVLATGSLAVLLAAATLVMVRAWVAFPYFLVCMGLLSARIGPFQALVGSIASEDRRGSLTSLVVSVGHVGFAAGSALAGPVYAAAGYRGSSMLGAAALAAAVLLVARLPEPSGRSGRAPRSPGDDRRSRGRPPRDAASRPAAPPVAVLPHAASRRGLGDNRLFGGLPRRALAAAVEVPELLEVAEGDVLCDEGDPPDFLYLIVEGTVRISKRGRGGRQESLAVLRAGDFFGEMGLYDPGPRSARATAASPLVVGRVDRGGLERILQLAPLQVSRNVLFGLVRRLRETDAHLIHQVLETERLSLLGSAAATIVHDLRDPISAARGAASLIVEDAADPRLVRMAEIVHRSVDRMNGMVQEILEFSRGETRLDTRAVAVPALLADVDRQLLEALPQRGITVERSIGWEGAVVVDPVRIVRVFQNLVKNAVEAMPAGGTLRISVERESDLAVVRVQDTGPGIPEEVRARLFEPFATHGKVNGTGLGMAIVRAIVEAHGGTVRLCTDTATGTAFRFTVPVAEH
jgi:signal transduction histidine kinase/predicted MFS family arabinose efflux permease